MRLKTLLHTVTRTILNNHEVKQNLYDKFISLSLKKERRTQLKESKNSAQYKNASFMLL